MSDNVYFISGGGTGGHIYPAFSVAEMLLKDKDTKKIYFIGNPCNLEAETVKNYPGVEFLPVDVSGMPRKLNVSFIKWAFQLFKAFLKALRYIKTYKPNTVFTTGGYVSAPVVLASVFTKTPYMIHDCDSVPGLVSKMAAPNAKIVSVAFENSKKLLKSSNIVFNGNPIRSAFFEVTKDDAKIKMNIPSDKTVIFAMGGSQGAKTINSATLRLLKTLTEDYNAFVILQTGKKNIDEVTIELEEIYPEYKNNKNLLVRPYFEDMVYPLKSADIVIARAGSVSLSEILQCGVVSILVPYPYATQNHQRKNAKEMLERGVSLYLEDSECNEDNLLFKIKELISDKNKFAEMSAKTEEFSKVNPTERIVEQLKSIIK